MKEDEHKLQIQQVPSRATKPDLSRNRSLYFLLLAKGRQKAINKPELRELYREALRSLEIKKINEFWEIKVDTSNGPYIENILRSEFRFYSTGLNNRSDQVVRDNSERAELFWDCFEKEIIPSKKANYRNNLKNFNLFCFKSKIAGTHFLQSLTLVIMFLPNEARKFFFICLGIAPLVRLFWHVKQKRILLLSSCALPVMLAMSMKSTASARSSIPLLIITLLASLLWSSFYNLKISKPRATIEKSALVICFLATAVIALREGVSTIFVSFLGGAAVLEIILMRLRANQKLSRSVSLFTYSFEAIMGLGLGGLLIIQSNRISVSRDTLYFLIAFVCFIIWILNLFIFESNSISFRLFYPFVFLCEVSPIRTTENLFLLSIAVIIVATFCRGNFSMRKLKSKL